MYLLALVLVLIVLRQIKLTVNMWYLRVSLSAVPQPPLDSFFGVSHQPNQKILVYDWPITSHVTQKTCSVL